MSKLPHILLAAILLAIAWFLSWEKIGWILTVGVALYGVWIYRSEIFGLFHKNKKVEAPTNPRVPEGPQPIIQPKNPDSPDQP